MHAETLRGVGREKLPFAGYSVDQMEVEDVRIWEFENLDRIPQILNFSNPQIPGFFENQDCLGRSRLRSLPRASSRQATACLAEAPSGAKAGTPGSK